MTARSRFAPALFAGCGALAPWLALEAGTRVLRDGRPLPLWGPALAIPAALAGAFAGVALARLCRVAPARASRLALAGGATLGFVLGRTLAQPLWRPPTSALGGMAAVASVLIASVLLALAAEAATLRAGPR